MTQDPAAIVANALSDMETDSEAGWARLDALLGRAMHGDVGAARALASATRKATLPAPRRLEIARQLLDAHAADFSILFDLGLATEVLVDRAPVNAAPPEDPYFHSVVRSLAIVLDGPLTDDHKHALSASLAVAAMVAGRRYDAIAEHAHRELLRLQSPLGWQTLFDLGLFLKTRGRYEEATELLLYATEIGGDSRSLFWNLAICATGCKRGELALEVWQEKLGIQGLRMGQYNLPEFRESPVQVRLAERPMATRDAKADHPGTEEIVWVERLSPAHGIVRNAVVAQTLDADFGDVVLFDGTPLATRTFSDKKVSVYAQLCTLIPGEAKRFPFRATQRTERQIAGLSSALPGKSVLYIPGEFDRGPGLGEELAAVEGAVCVPKEVDVRDVVDLLDAVLAEQNDGDVRVLCPALHEANGDLARSRREQEQFNAWQSPSRSG